MYPYSESSFDFRKRTVNAIEAILATHEGHRVVIACHGGVINAYLAHLLKLDEDMFFHPAHTAVNVVLAAPDGATGAAVGGRRTPPLGRRPLTDHVLSCSPRPADARGAPAPGPGA